MRVDRELVGKTCILRQIELSDCTERYVEWLNDPLVNRYLETKWSEQNVNTIKKFVKNQIESDDSILFAIMNGQREHIGNIKIGPIHEHYRYADISYFIGEKGEWGKGIATEAIHLVCQYGFSILHLNRIEAGTYQNAIGSQKALERNGFSKEATFRRQVYYDGEWINIYLYGLLFDEFIIS